MLQIIDYNQSYKKKWDDFIQKSKNGTFLFFRDYMEYHSNRFKDSSLLFVKNTIIYAVLPANIDHKILYSHQGLTYGGFIFSNKVSIGDVLQMFELLISKLNTLGIEKVIYKAIPYIYHKLPSQEDIYALFRINAKKIGCNISSSIFQSNKIKFNESRKSGLRKATKQSLSVNISEQYDQFIEILNENLNKKYGIQAVHTASEIISLRSLFPENIKLYVVQKSNRIIAGTILYMMPHYIHVQYMAANEEGKQTGALDLLFDHLINKIYTSVPVLDFGHSSEQNGHYLNENLIFQKEGFGGRAVCYDFYAALSCKIR